MRLSNALWLYGVISKNDLTEAEYLKRIEDSIKGGVSILQIREKTGTREDIVKLCLKVKAITDKHHIPLIINDDVSICEEIDADGVHLGQSDGSVTDARKRLGDGKIIGVSANTLPLARKAVDEGADYLGTGAMFVTSTKLDAKSTKLETLKAICNEVPIPVVAIGGIGQTNAHQLMGAKVAGIAVVSALYSDGRCFDNAKALRALADSLAMPKKRLIICDVDGVLLESVNVWDGVAREYLIGKGVSPKDDLEDVVATLHFEGSIALFQKEYGVNDDAETIVSALNDIIKGRYLRDVTLKPHALEFLQRASQRCRVYLCSDTHSDVLTPVLQKFGLLDYADGLVTSNIAGCFKSHDRIYRYCNEKSGFSMEDTMVLEDYLYAMKTAKSAGYYVVGVREQNSFKHEEEIKCVADQYIESLRDMEAIL